jgi:predicted nucleic acid-binding protein
VKLGAEGGGSAVEAVFVDTGAFVARYLPDDQHHAEAVIVWDELRRRGGRWFTSNLVLAETFTLLGRRSDHRFAAQRAHTVYRSARAVVLRPDESDEVAALDLFQRFADQGVSYVDCVSFALMKAHRLRRAFTFDHHFAVAGFRVIPAYGEAGWVMEPEV